MTSWTVRSDSRRPATLRAGVLRHLPVLLVFACMFGPAPASTPEHAGDMPRLLVIAIDGIPYDLIEGLTGGADSGEPLFPGLAGPAALVNAFPSNSYTTWSGLLRPFEVDLPLGYEARYFNRNTSRLDGGLTPIPVPAPWREFFDWYLKGVSRKAIAYGWPKRWSLRELRQGLEAFRNSDQRAFAMYVVSTDGLGHVYGPEGLAEFLRSMDRILEEFRRDYPDEEFYSFLFSDHGMAGGDPLDNIWPDVRAKIKQTGYRTSRRLKRARDATVVSYGLLSSFVVYTDTTAADALAQAIASVEGVDLCVTRRAGEWMIHGGNGSARIERAAGYGQVLWRYEMINGDPLGYAPVVEQLRRHSGIGQGVWFPDHWWFEATSGQFYPDALYRLTEAFRLSANPASIICSVAPGFMFGARRTDWVARPTIGRLRWTHGALHRDASTGFVMTDLPEWNPPDAVRFDEALEILVPYFKEGDE